MDELWEKVWGELRGELSRQPRCPEHPQLPCIRTLDQGAVNDILRVDHDGVQVRSHRTGNEDVIPASAFRAWWAHLQQHGTAALDPNDPNCPRSDRAVLVGAILAGCLPDRVKREGGQIRLLPDSGPQDVPLPEEVPIRAAIVEGAARTVMVNAYERNPQARRQCIDAHGTTCCICGFSFGAVYGPLAEAFIHVHYLKPLSEIGEEYRVDPVVDLRPVCPNCHAVIHLGGQCRDIDEVRQLLQLAAMANKAVQQTERA